MNDLHHWQAQNDNYLGAALAWLRLCLERQVELMGSASTSTLPYVLDAVPADAAKEDKQAPRLEHAVAEESLEQAHAAMTAASEGEPPPALLLLARQLALSDFEREILLLCLGIELDTRIASLCARAQDNPNRPYPTFALALAMFDDPAWEALSPERPLRYWRLLEINQPAAQPLTTSALQVDERILSYVKGLNYIDDRLTPLLSELLETDGSLLPASQQALVRTIESQFATTHGPQGPILLLGHDRQSKRHVAAAVADSLKIHIYRLGVDSLPPHVGELETLARLWQRESLLLPLALYIDAQDLDPAATGDGAITRLTRFVQRCGGLVFIDLRNAPGTAFERAFSIEVNKPTSAEQRALWTDELGQQASDIPQRLAGQFNLNRFDIASVVELAQQGDVSQPLETRLWHNCLAKTRPSMDRLAEKLDAKATWEQIVLPEQETRLLGQIAAQVEVRSRVYDDWGFRARMNRGLGIITLFTGDSGTGKTMAAEVLANALSLDLYRIDLSAVVSKYIGETEKNLRRVFDAAEEGGAILFFDEADAIFGKRSEVKDSHDRYANIEINYLLQRMEAYSGLAILATNMKSALDSAFMRRLRFIVNFPFPSISERARIWARVFPSEAEIDELEFDRLARFKLTGGSIHNIALNAAFLAAQDGGRVTMPLIFEATRNEFRKLERPINEADFRLVTAVGRMA
jgi:hypothetical protein